MLLLLLGSTVARAAGGEAVNRLVAAGELDKAQERCDKALEMTPVAADLAEACGALALQSADHATSKIAAYQRIVGNWPGTKAAAEATSRASELALVAAGTNVEKLEAVAREWSATPAAGKALDRAVESLVKAGRADLLLAYAERHMDDSGDRARAQAYAVAWSMAERTNTAASWAGLLERTPDHPRAEDARRRMQEAQLAEAGAAGTCAAWTALEATDHPSLSLIHTEADRSCLAEAEAVGTSAAFASLLAARPTSSLRDQVDARRRALLLDETAARGAPALLDLALREPSLATDARRRAMGLYYTVEVTIPDGRADQPARRVRLRTDGARALDPWGGTVTVTATAGAPAYAARLVVVGADGASRDLGTWADELRAAGLATLVGVDLGDHGQRSGTTWTTPLPAGRCGRDVDLAVELTVGSVAARWPFTYTVTCADVARWSTPAPRGTGRAEAPARTPSTSGDPSSLSAAQVLAVAAHQIVSAEPYVWGQPALEAALHKADPSWIPAGTFPTDGRLPPSLAVACQESLRAQGSWTWGCGRWTAMLRPGGRSRLTTRPHGSEATSHVAPVLSGGAVTTLDPRPTAPPPELAEILRFALPVPGPTDTTTVAADLDADGHDETVEAACLRPPLLGCTVAVLRRRGGTDDLWFVSLPGSTLPRLTTVRRLDDTYIQLDSAGTLRWAGDGPTLDR